MREIRLQEKFLNCLDENKEDNNLKHSSTVEKEHLPKLEKVKLNYREDKGFLNGKISEMEN